MPRIWNLFETGNIYPINSLFYDVNSLIKLLKLLVKKNYHLKNILKVYKILFRMIKYIIIYWSVSCILFSSQPLCQFLMKLVWPLLTVLILIKMVSSPIIRGWTEQRRVWRSQYIFLAQFPQVLKLLTSCMDLLTRTGILEISTILVLCDSPFFKKIQ